MIVDMGPSGSYRSTSRPDTLHDLRSVTKSIVGLLYGIALDRVAVPPPWMRRCWRSFRNTLTLPLIRDCARLTIARRADDDSAGSTGTKTIRCTIRKEC